MIVIILIGFVIFYCWWATRPRLKIGDDDRLYRIKSRTKTSITIAGKFGVIPTSNDEFFLILRGNQ